ncbi:MAG TPA: excinuclease ABC subunit UvrA, partial [Ktedonobacterales bacterium]
MPLDSIVVRGAREHNLKNIDVVIPRDRLVVITGLSGSGKSSLAFDTIFAEGQRRYVESLSAYARQFLGQMEKPDVDHIDGLSPAISIDQKSTTHNPRSTVGTVTEVYDYLRLLYARVGHPHCPNCGREVSQQTVEQIVNAILDLPDATRLMLLAPLVRGRKGEYRQVFEEMRRAGYVRVRVDGQVRDLADEIDLEKNKQHTIEVVVDRLVIRHTAPALPAPVADDNHAGANGNGNGYANGAVHPADLKLVAERPTAYAPDSATPEDPEASQRARVADSVETTLKLGTGIILVSIIDGEERLYSERFACVYCGISLEEIQPRTFSFNNPHGACPECTGLGTKLEVDGDLIVTNPDLSLSEGAILPWSRFASTSTWYTSLLTAVARHFNFSLETPWKALSDAARDIILRGSSEEVAFYYRNRQGTRREHRASFEGVIPNLERRYKEASEFGRHEIEQYMSARPCPVCKGARLKPESLAVTVGGLNIKQAGDLSITNALRFFQSLNASNTDQPAPADTPADPELPANITPISSRAKRNGRAASSSPPPADVGAHGYAPVAGVGGLASPPLTEREQTIGRQVLKEINARLGFLVNVGLDYLSLNRAAATLSGGEAQRIRLATQIGSSLMGVLYILDEPSIGLHQRDNARLIRTLEHLRELGNTLLVVEHDEETMRAADHIIDIGPAAGEHGGRVIAEGTFAEIAANPNSITGQYLSGQRAIHVPSTRRAGNGHSVVVRGARENNLKDVSVAFPLGRFIAVTGVSGSGKSSLVNEILHKRLAQMLNRAHARPGAYVAIEGVDALDKVIDIDQSPIGRTPRS